MKELEDHAWFPSLLRNYQTDFVGYATVALQSYRPLLPLLHTISERCETMADLCSGSGAPACDLFSKSRFRRLLLSDKFPRTLHRREAKMYYYRNEADITTMNFLPGNCYTIFNSFHHFSDEEKVQVVQKLTRSGSHGIIAEILEPRFIMYLKVLLMTTLGTLVLTPFVRPFSLFRLIFTYLVPINIITITFDGMVSVAKSRSLSRYKQLFKGHDGNIKVFRLENWLSSLIVIAIQPQNENSIRGMEIHSPAHADRQRC